MPGRLDHPSSGFDTTAMVPSTRAPLWPPPNPHLKLVSADLPRIHTSPPPAVTFRPKHAARGSLPRYQRLTASTSLPLIPSMITFFHLACPPQCTNRTTERRLSSTAVQKARLIGRWRSMTTQSVNQQSCQCRCLLLVSRPSPRTSMERL